jgi:hypothetical protein
MFDTVMVEVAPPRSTVRSPDPFSFFEELSGNVARYDACDFALGGLYLRQ